jgi:hypothetical protein
MRRVSELNKLLSSYATYLYVDSRLHEWQLLIAFCLLTCVPHKYIMYCRYQTILTLGNLGELCAFEGQSL